MFFSEKNDAKQINSLKATEFLSFFCPFFFRAVFWKKP